MQRYVYVAKDQSGKNVKGVMFAENELDLAEKVRNSGHFLSSSKIAKGVQSGNKGRRGLKMKPHDLLIFTQHLGTLIEAGIPLVGGLKNLSKTIDNENAKKIIDDICARTESGSYLKEALSAHPRVFSSLYTSIIGAGEATGKLTLVLESLSSYLEWDADLKAKIKEAATYPIILFCVMIMVIVMLMIKVVPIFKPLFATAGVELPLPTRVVMGISDVITGSWYIILIVVGALVGIYRYIYSTPKGAYQIDKLKLKFPLFGGLLKNIIISRFCYILGLALKSGVNVLSALEMGAEAMDNNYLRQIGLKVRDAVNVGEKIADSMEESGQVPSLVIQMIKVGEESGNIAQNLEKVSAFYDKELPRVIRGIFALFEPLMIVVMGIIVGGIALAVFLPMIQLAELAGG